MRWLSSPDDKGLPVPKLSVSVGAQPNANIDQFSHTGFLRLSSVLAPKGPIPVGRSTWWAGVKAGRFPKPIKLGPRTTAWRVEDIRALIERGVL
jgi:prophage regulatory protein